MGGFWVVGGVYTSTRFDEFAEGRDVERCGPFATYREARKEWRRLSWIKVDDCHVRYRIEEAPVC